MFMVHGTWYIPTYVFAPSGILKSTTGRQSSTPVTTSRRDVETVCVCVGGHTHNRMRINEGMEFGVE